MGCKNSKPTAPKFKLTDVQRRAIQENAQSLVLTNALLRVSASNCAARFRGNRTKENILRDTTPLADYFGNTPIPPELGNGEKSVADAFAAVKKLAFENISGRLGPQIEEQQPKIRHDIELQKAARHMIQAESDAAVTSVTEDLVEKCIFVATHPPEPAKVSPAAQTRVHEVPEVAVAIPSRSVGNAATKATAGSYDVPQPRQQNRSVEEPLSDGGVEDIVLPAGEWVKAEGTPYYYSAAENLYYHPPSGQFYDPSNEMWYDPDKDEWYQEDADDEQHGN